MTSGKELKEQIKNSVRLIDTDDSGLELYCSTSNDSVNDFTKKYRGIIFHGDSVVFNGFPYSEEYTTSQSVEIEKVLGNIFDTCKFYTSYEGSIIRMFYFDSKWYISTHRKLNAYKSKWGSHCSYGDFFEEALFHEFSNRLTIPEDENGRKYTLEYFKSILDPEIQYIFLLENNKQNRVVCNVAKSRVFQVGAFKEGKLCDVPAVLPSPEEHHFSCIPDLLTYVNNIDIYSSQGVIVFGLNNTQYKIYNDHYKYLFDIRGNEPSIKFRYLQLRMDKDRAELLKELYPDSIPYFERYENAILSIAWRLYNAYVNRFIKKQYVIVPKDEFQIIKEVHSRYLANREYINVNVFLEVLDMTNVHTLNTILKRQLFSETH